MLVAAVSTALSILALVDVVDGGQQNVAEPLALALTCASLAAWLAFIAIAVRDSVCERLDEINTLAVGRVDELAGQIAALAEMVSEYGDQREAGGYLAHARDSIGTNGQIHRVK